MARDGLIGIGVVTRPHGIRGEVRVRLYNPESVLLLERASVWLRGAEDQPPRRMRVDSARRGPKGLLLRFAEARSRDEAEALRGRQVCVPRDELPPIEESEVHYVVDLVGLPVRQQDGTLVGEVEDVLSYPSIECLKVRSVQGVREVPMMEPWVQRIDPEAGEVTVGPLDDVPLQPA